MAVEMDSLMVLLLVVCWEDWLEYLSVGGLEY